MLLRFAMDRAFEQLLDDLDGNDRGGLQQIDLIAQLLKAYERQGVDLAPEDPNDMSFPGQTVIELAEETKDRIEVILEEFDFWWPVRGPCKPLIASSPYREPSGNS